MFGKRAPLAGDVVPEQLESARLRSIRLSYELVVRVTTKLWSAGEVRAASMTAFSITDLVISSGFKGGCGMVRAAALISKRAFSTTVF